MRCSLAAGSIHSSRPRHATTTMVRILSAPVLTATVEMDAPAHRTIRKPGSQQRVAGSTASLDPTVQLRRLGLARLLRRLHESNYCDCHLFTRSRVYDVFNSLLEFVVGHGVIGLSFRRHYPCIADQFAFTAHCCISLLE